MMCVLYSHNPEYFSSPESTRFLEVMSCLCYGFSAAKIQIMGFLLTCMWMQSKRKAELNRSRLCFSLSSYLYFMVKKKSLRLQVYVGQVYSLSLVCCLHMRITGRDE